MNKLKDMQDSITRNEGDQSLLIILFMRKNYDIQLLHCNIFDKNVQSYQIEKRKAAEKDLKKKRK